jgi:kinesin family protein 1
LSYAGTSGYHSKRSRRLNKLNVTKTFIHRPYIYIYANHSETDEHGVINLAAVRIDHQKHIEELLQVKAYVPLFFVLCTLETRSIILQACDVLFQRSNVFALYTNNNAYLMQAANRPDMIDWISKLDQFYPVDKLT